MPDGAEGRTFRFRGEGQHGNMEFRAGNAAIRDHAGSRKQLRLFEADGFGRARYFGQLVYAGHDVVPDVPDGSANRRTAFVFRLARR